MISGVSLEALSIDIMSKSDNHRMFFKKGSCPTPLKYVDVVHTTSDVLQEHVIDDYWNVDGDRTVKAMDRFHAVHDTESYSTSMICAVWGRC